MCECIDFFCENSNGNSRLSIEVLGEVTCKKMFLKDTSQTSNTKPYNMVSVQPDTFVLSTGE